MAKANAKAKAKAKAKSKAKAKAKAKARAKARAKAKAREKAKAKGSGSNVPNGDPHRRASNATGTSRGSHAGSSRQATALAHTPIPPTPGCLKRHRLERHHLRHQQRLRPSQPKHRWR